MESRNVARDFTVEEHEIGEGDIRVGIKHREGNSAPVLNYTAVVSVYVHPYAAIKMPILINKLLFSEVQIFSILISNKSYSLTIWTDQCASRHHKTKSRVSFPFLKLNFADCNKTEIKLE